MASELETQILSDAENPAEVASDEGRAKSRPLKELIEADEYLSRKRAGRSASGGIRFTKIVPPSPE